MSPFQRAAGVLCCVSVKHLPLGFLPSLVLAQKGSSTDGAELPPCPPPYRRASHITLQNRPKLALAYSTVRPTLNATWASVGWKGQHLPWKKSIFLILWVQSPSPGRAGQVELCSSLTCSAASADLSPLWAVFYFCCPWGCQIFKKRTLVLHASCDFPSTHK